MITPLIIKTAFFFSGWYPPFCREPQIPSFDISVSRRKASSGSLGTPWRGGVKTFGHRRSWWHLDDTAIDKWVCHCLCLKNRVPNVPKKNLVVYHHFSISWISSMAIWSIPCFQTQPLDPLEPGDSSCPNGLPSAAPRPCLRVTACHWYHREQISGPHCEDLGVEQHGVPWYTGRCAPMAIFVTRGIWLTGWAWYCLVVTSASKLSLRIAWGSSSMCSHRLEGHLWDMCHSGSHNDGGIGRDPWHIDPCRRSSWSSLAQMMVHFSGQSALLKLFLVIRYLRLIATVGLSNLECVKFMSQIFFAGAMVKKKHSWMAKLFDSTVACTYCTSVTEMISLGVWELWTSYFISVHLENRN